VDLELLFWEGCPSHPQAAAELRAALAELGRSGQEIRMVDVTSESQAARERFIGSPTIRINGVDAVPPPPHEPTGLACRVYRLRDGRYSPTPDPADLRDALRAALPSNTKED
jgi:hypothetical protein